VSCDSFTINGQVIGMNTQALQNDELLDALEAMAQYGIPRADSAHWFDVGTGPYLDYFEREVIDTFLAQGGATCRFFEGAYGAGKTHLLQLLKSLALRKGMIVASTDLSQAVKLEDWRQITEYIMQHMEAVVAGVHVRSLPAIIAAMSGAGIIQPESLRRTHAVHPGYHNALYWASHAQHLEPAAWNCIQHYLLGKKVNVTEFRRYNLSGVKGQLSIRNAELVLKTLMNGLYLLGVPGVLLLFDENERTLTSSGAMPPKKHRMAANLIRRLIDGCTTGLLTGTGVLFGVLPGFLEHCSNAYPALGQRLQIVRGGLPRRAWRVPIQMIDKVNVIEDQEDFLREVIQLLMKHVQTLGGTIQGLQEKLMKTGEVVLEHNVGLGYKRELMKALTSVSLQYIGNRESEVV